GVEDRAQVRRHALAHREVLARGCPGGLRLGPRAVLEEDPRGEGLFGRVTRWQAHAGAVDVHDRVWGRVRDGVDAPGVARALLDGAGVERQAGGGADGEQRAAATEVGLVAEGLGGEGTAARLEEVLEEGERLYGSGGVVGVAGVVVVEDVTAEGERP